ncbi:unnamed protein product, partial [Adineta steineri]
MDTKTLSFVGNFTFDVHDQSDLYYFVGGPVAVNPDLSLIYMPITGATSFQRLFLLAYNYNTSTYYQSPWMYNNGDIAFLYYDPIRKRLFGLRDKSTFTFFIEEYDLQSLNVTKLYTKQDGEKYAFSFAACTCFDYNENWIIQVRTLGQKEDIVVDFHLMPNVNNFLTMTYDIQQTKLILGTWQHGSIELDVYMF